VRIEPIYVYVYIHNTEEIGIGGASEWGFYHFIFTGIVDGRKDNGP
jgi:hypothetical protein